MTTLTYRNPVLPGFYPDPSVIRVGEDYYMVNSTFEYFPGVPIFHSKNLIQWEQIGNVLTRESQVNLRSRKSSEGIFAPVLRHHAGVFYMITTDVQGIGNFYVTTNDPTGPWSDPIKIPYGNIDPSLFFDDDGKVYVSAQSGFGETSHVIQYEIDIATGKALTEPVVVWKGDEGPWVEGPHLYKINGLYYMLTASGGTGPQHREIIGRSVNPYGPFEMLSHPILTHNGLKDHPIQYLGHVELINDAAGNWWAMFLGVRLLNNRGSVLGRETFLAPVQWNDDGWPMIDNNEGTVALTMEVNVDVAIVDVTDTVVAPSAAIVSRTEFGTQGLGLEWFYTRVRPTAEAMSLTEREGCLTLKGNSSTIRDGGSTVFICRRQQHHSMRVETELTFDANQAGEAAGIAARLSDETYYALGVSQLDGHKGILLSISKKGVASQSFTALTDRKGSLRLAIHSDQEAYEFLYAENGGHWISLGTQSASDLAPDSEGAFTGVCVGMFAAGTTENDSAPAYFHYFEYEGFED